MKRSLTLALVQFEPKLGDLAANLERVLGLTREAAGQKAEFVIFPELALTGYNQELLGDKLVELALTPADEPIRQLAQAADQHNIHLIVGFVEKRAVPGVVYNSIVICGPEGSVLATYAKTHLFSSENLYFRPGASLNSLRTKHGVIGPMICMDIGYPEVARILSLQGAELLLAASAWITEDEDIWPLHLKARALDNLVFVAGINRVGDEGQLHFIGQTMLVDPRGRVLAELGSGEDILVTTIDLDEVTKARRRALHWTGRRPELYGPISELTSS
jgi:predicted amidohydrolase